LGEAAVAKMPSNKDMLDFLVLIIFTEHMIFATRYVLTEIIGGTP